MRDAPKFGFSRARGRLMSFFCLLQGLDPAEVAHRFLVVQQSTYGSSHPEVYDALENLVGILLDKGR